MNLDFLNAVPHGQLVKIATNFVLTLLLILFANRLISLFFSGLIGRASLASYRQRLQTLRSLLQNIIITVLFFALGIGLLQDLGYNITPVLTGVGIAGLAISFGAQTLIKDFISGFFILIENQYNVGDHVTIMEHQGTVHQIHLRITVLEDKDGNLVYIPNSEIKKVVVHR